jgi:serine/threonine protein kinase
MSQEDCRKTLDLCKCLDDLRKGWRWTEQATRRLFHLLSDDGQPVPFDALADVDWLTQAHREFLPESRLVTEEVLVRMLMGECPQPLLAPPTVSIPGPRMSEEDSLRQGIWRMYVYLGGSDGMDDGLGQAARSYFAACLGLSHLPCTRKKQVMPYEALYDLLSKLDTETVDGVKPEDAKQLHEALALLGDPSRAIWPQPEAKRLVSILATPGPCDATRFVKFAEQVGLPIPAVLPLGGIMGQWEPEDFAQFLWPELQSVTPSSRYSLSSECPSTSTTPKSSDSPRRASGSSQATSSSDSQPPEFARRRSKRTYYAKGQNIGSGGFSRVYRAMDIDTGALYAVKAVERRERTAKDIEDLRKEIEAMKMLKHDRIVEYICVDATTTHVHILLELIAGGSVAELLHLYGSFTQRVISCYTRQVLEGLEYMHFHDIVHRDIKGANILITAKGQVKLTDFGICIHLRQPAAGPSGTGGDPPGHVPLNGVAHTEELAGTARWMAPETIRDAGNIGKPADVWSLGCAIIEMATGYPPWEEKDLETREATFWHIAFSDETPLIPSRLNADTRNFTEQCLRRDPMARPDVAELREHPMVAPHVPSTVASETSGISRNASETSLTRGFSQTGKEVMTTGTMGSPIHVRVGGRGRRPSFSSIPVTTSDSGRPGGSCGSGSPLPASPHEPPFDPPAVASSPEEPYVPTHTTPQGWAPRRRASEPVAVPGALPEAAALGSRRRASLCAAPTSLEMPPSRGAELLEMLAPADWEALWEHVESTRMLERHKQVAQEMYPND